MLVLIGVRLFLFVLSSFSVSVFVFLSDAVYLLHPHFVFVCVLAVLFVFEVLFYSCSDVFDSLEASADELSEGVLSRLASEFRLSGCAVGAWVCYVPIGSGFGCWYLCVD